MMSTYVVLHSIRDNNTEEEKYTNTGLVGVYSTKEKAEKAIDAKSLIRYLISASLTCYYSKDGTHKWEIYDETVL